MNKTAVADFAAKGFARTIGLENDFRTNNNCDFLEVAFTKRCDPIKKKILLGFIQEVCETLEIEYAEQPMTSVTRDRKLWDV